MRWKLYVLTSFVLSKVNRQKANILTIEEITELARITELDRIFTLMDARIIAE